MDIASIGKIPPAAAAPVAVAEPQSVEQRALIQAVKAVNAAELFGSDNELTFVFDRSSRRAIARLVNRQTREVIKQFPPEYVLRMAEESKQR
jgi:uncharacterized FlaG/YvyC family protein